jgi:invasion protein IalB
MTHSKTFRFCGALALSILASAPALAQSAPKLASTHGDWTVYTRGSGGERICYVLSEALSKSPTSVNHGDIYFMVSSWKNGAATEQPSFLAGYNLKTTRAPQAKVGSTSLNMFAADNEAFISETADERRLVSKMRAGSTMTVSAVSSRGTQTRYTFSLKGGTAALRQAKSACS